MNEEVAFQLIAKSGTAFSLLVTALKLARTGHFDECEDKIKEAKMLMDEAHNHQTSLITKEANGELEPVSVLLVHAQDHLMNTILLFTIVEEFLYLYKEKEGQV